MKRIALLLICLTLLLSGCNGLDGETTTTYGETPPGNYWAIDVWIEEFSPENSRSTFSGYVSITTPFQGELRGVELQFQGPDHTVLARHPVGNISKTGQRKWVNTTAPSSTRYIVPNIDEVDTPNESRGGVYGYEVRDDGSLIEYGGKASNFTR